MINVIIVDDEPLAQDVLETYVEKVPDLNLVAKCSNAHGRFLFAPLPPVGDGDPMHPSGFGAMRGNDPADVNKFMEKHGRFAGVTINLEFLAHLIATKAGLPLIRMVANSEADD